MADRARSSSPASSRPAASTSATSSARSASTSRGRTAATRRSSASSTCTRSRSPTTRPTCASASSTPPRSCSPPGSTRSAASSSASPTCAPAHRADLAPLGGHLARRPRSDDPVQGKDGERARAGLGGALLLPGADGRRRARLPGDRGAGRRRPAPARRADAGDRAALQRALRRARWWCRSCGCPRSARGSWTCRSRSGRCRRPAGPSRGRCWCSTTRRRSARRSARR